MHFYLTLYQINASEGYQNLEQQLEPYINSAVSMVVNIFYQFL